MRRVINVVRNRVHHRGFGAQTTFSRAGPVQAQCLLSTTPAASDGKPKKLWGGRFTGATDPLMEAFNASIGFDKRFCIVDIEGSQAYARALARAKLLTDDEATKLVDGLDLV